jgi:guanosine-3',5'-bis(diphosphate) 3'-pyrophosphohydrolase
MTLIMATNTLVEKAKDVARKIHENQFRKSGEGYAEHVEKVAGLLTELGVIDENTLAAAYLHHAFEATHSINIEKEFNPEILQVVTDYKNLSEDKFSTVTPSSISADLMVQTYFNIAKNPKTLLIRLADKTANIRVAHKLPKEISHRAAEKALYVYSPLCKLIGLQKFVTILEDGAFKILNPRDYYKIEHYIKTNYPRINQELEDVTKFLKEILEENNIKSEIDSRKKGIYSTHIKLKRYFEKGSINVVTDFKGIMDYAGLRILVDNEEDCYKCEDILNNSWDAIANTRDDYITNPKPNGYKSLQCSYLISNNFVLEVQIKTFAMHEENQFGKASHTLYKVGEALGKNIQNDPHVLKSINYSINREEFDIKTFSKFVYVYTPKGDIKKLPRGANLLDFAYTIHKDLGNCAIGGDVNGEFKPLEFVLSDGDTIFIKTHTQKKGPSRKFLELVKTRKAREQIKKASTE